MSYDKRFRDVTQRAIGNWYVKDGQAIPMGYPIEDDGTTVSNPLLKQVCKQYSDATGSTTCAGISMQKVTAKPTSTEDQILKPTWMPRDLGVLLEGDVKLTNQDSGVDISVGDDLSPHPSGFIKYHTGSGMVWFGTALEDIPDGETGWTHINVTGGQR